MSILVQREWIIGGIQLTEEERASMGFVEHKGIQFPEPLSKAKQATIEDLVKLVDQKLKDVLIPDRVRYLEEALVNAMHHGNGLDVAKTVLIRMQAHREGIRVILRFEVILDSRGWGYVAH